MEDKIATLHITHPHPDPRLATLLPPEIAQRFQALPVASDGEHITVAMARPDDPAARQAVCNVLGPETYVVDADTEELAQAIDKLWPHQISSNLHFMSWTTPKASPTSFGPFAHCFSQLMEARLTAIHPTERKKYHHDFVLHEVQHQHPDLLIINSNLTIFPAWLTPKSAENKLIKQMSVSLLVIRNPHWPLKNILLVLRDSNFDTEAITWAVQIATRSKASITMLPLVAPLPRLYAELNFQYPSSVNLLNSTSPLGDTLRQVSKSLADKEIHGILSFREGSTTEQIQQELNTRNYDLAIIAADTQRSLAHWMMGELVNPLLNLADLPVLLAKPC